MTDPDDLSQWLNLGSYEVLAIDFESAGEPWDEVFPAEFSEPVPDWLRAELPATGWREVTARDRLEPSRIRRLFAAPTDGGAWMTASVWPQDGGLPVFMGDLGTHRLRPTQDIRRAGLALGWGEPLRVAGTELDAVTVTLTNTADSVWISDGEDHAFVHAHFLDADGQRPANCGFAFAPLSHDFKGRTLAPGESMELPVAFGHDDAPAPGSYAVEAILVSLNVRTPVGRLEVVDASDTAPRMRFSDAQNAARLHLEESDRAIEQFMRDKPSDS